MKSIAASLLLLEASVAAARNVLQMDIRKPVHRVSGLSKRAKTVMEPLGNEETLYYANVSIGTPPQFFQLQVDTGSSDVWTVQAGDSYCRQRGACVGGQFDPSKSSTYKVVDQGAFQIQYVDETGATGDFFTDNFVLGPSGSTTTVKGLQMGLATNTSIGTGIMGVGFAEDESVCSQRSSFTSASGCRTYPTLTQMLVSQNYINSQAYSLWLNDLDANSGSILFGGVDTAKFVGSLITIPIQPDSQTETITSFTVAWTNLTLGVPNGNPINGFVSSDFAQPAILDSGTSLTLLPDDIAQKVYQEFGATYNREVGGYIASCRVAASTATFDFAFGGPGGPVIRVPADEFLLPLTSDDGSPVQFRNGDQVCQMGIEAAGENPILFGDTFLRSAYVVYDLDNKQISLAQTKFNVTESNIQEIKAGSSSNVPNVASTVTGATVRQTESTGPLGNLGGLFGGGSGSRASATANAGALNSQLASGTGAPLLQYTAVNTLSPQPSGNAAAGSTAGTVRGVVTPGLNNEGAWMTALIMGSAAIGSAILLL